MNRHGARVPEREQMVEIRGGRTIELCGLKPARVELDLFVELGRDLSAL